VCAQSSLGAEVDITKIGLWGTSFAGGHVLVTAAKEGTNVTAVVSQVGTRSSPQDIQALIELGDFVCFTHSHPALIGMLTCSHVNAISSHVHEHRSVMQVLIPKSGSFLARPGEQSIALSIAGGMLVPEP